VPLQAEWAAVVAPTALNITNYTTAASSVLHLPAAGRRYYNGLLAEQGARGYYWSSSPISTNAYYFLFITTASSTNSVQRANGYSVRCIKN
jgi:uncharacterized protein (TIGR02145 family)